MRLKCRTGSAWSTSISRACCMASPRCCRTCANANRVRSSNMSSIAGHKVFPASAVYSATKFAVRAISEGLRQESNGDFRVMNISRGAIATELTNTISDASTAENVNELYEVAIGADAIARAIAYAIEQPDDVDINELIIRPTKQPL